MSTQPPGIAPPQQRRRLDQDDGVDWSQGPVACAGGCGSRLRPRGSAGRGRWEDTVPYCSHGCCRSCSGGVEPSRRRLRWVWRALPGLPVVHQEHEAVADLMDHLRSAGLVLMGRSRRRVVHGARPVIVLDCVVRAQTPEERSALAPSAQGPRGSQE